MAVDTKASDSTVTKKTIHHPEGEPVASPAPPLDGRKPIAEGKDAVEKFLVTTDTGGGD